MSNGSLQSRTPAPAPKQTAEELRADISPDLHGLIGDIEKDKQGKDYSALFDRVISAIREEGKTDLSQKIQYESWTEGAGGIDQFKQDIQTVFAKFDPNGKFEALYTSIVGVDAAKQKDFMLLLQHKLLAQDKIINETKAVTQEISNEEGGNILRDSKEGLSQFARTVEKETGIPQGVTKAAGYVLAGFLAWKGVKNTIGFITDLFNGGDHTKRVKAVGWFGTLGLGIFGASKLMDAYSPNPTRGEANPSGPDAPMPDALEGSVAHEMINEDMDSYAALMWATADDCLDILNMSVDDPRQLHGQLKQQVKGSRLAKKDQKTLIERANPIELQNTVRYVIDSFAYLPVPPRQQGETAMQYIKREYVDAAQRVGTVITFPELLVTAVAIRKEYATSQQNAMKSVSIVSSAAAAVFAPQSASTAPQQQRSPAVSPTPLTQEHIDAAGSLSEIYASMLESDAYQSRHDIASRLRMALGNNSDIKRFSSAPSWSSGQADFEFMFENTQFRLRFEEGNANAQITEIDRMSSGVREIGSIAIADLSADSITDKLSSANVSVSASEQDPWSPNRPRSATESRETYSIVEYRSVDEMKAGQKITVIGLSDSLTAGLAGGFAGGNPAELLSDPVKGPPPADVRHDKISLDADRYWAQVKISIPLRPGEAADAAGSNEKVHTGWICVWGGGSANIKQRKKRTN